MVEEKHKKESGNQHVVVGASCKRGGTGGEGGNRVLIIISNFL
jgi:hypothetical protein